MRNFLTRILLASVLTLVALALASSANAQQADDDRTPATQSQSTTPPQSSQPRGTSASFPDDGQTQEALAFTGRVMKEQGRLLLKDPVTKMSYELDDQAKAKPYLGNQVRVTGKLEMKSNTIHIDGIEPLS